MFFCFQEQFFQSDLSLLVLFSLLFVLCPISVRGSNRLALRDLKGCGNDDFPVVFFLIFSMSVSSDFTMFLACILSVKYRFCLSSFQNLPLILSDLIGSTLVPEFFFFSLLT